MRKGLTLRPHAHFPSKEGARVEMASPAREREGPSGPSSKMASPRAQGCGLFPWARSPLYGGKRSDTYRFREGGERSKLEHNLASPPSGLLNAQLSQAVQSHTLGLAITTYAQPWALITIFIP